MREEDGRHAAAPQLANDLILADRRGLELVEDPGPGRHAGASVPTAGDPGRHHGRIGRHSTRRAVPVAGQQPLPAAPTSVYKRTARPAKPVVGCSWSPQMLQETAPGAEGVEPVVHRKPKLRGFRLVDRQ